MNVNEKGLNIIKDSEGCVLHVYPDPGTNGRPYTAGYGHAGKDIQTMRVGDPITQDQADSWLRQDIAATEKGLTSFFQGTKLTSNQFSALVSFAYNVGGWRSSTLFRLAKASKFDLAAKDFCNYNHAAGKVEPGLTKRRQAEQTLFSTPDDSST